MTSLPEADPASEAIRFRPSKKRKVYRQRDDPSPDEAPSIPADVPAATERGPDGKRDGDDDNDDESVVAAALRLRNARRARQGGVAFTAAARSEHDQQSSDQSLVPAQIPASSQTADEHPLVHSTTDRFTQERSLVSSMTTKYMYASPPSLSPHAPGHCFGHQGLSPMFFFSGRGLIIQDGIYRIPSLAPQQRARRPQR